MEALPLSDLDYTSNANEALSGGSVWSCTKCDYTVEGSRGNGG